MKSRADVYVVIELPNIMQIVTINNVQLTQIKDVLKSNFVTSICASVLGTGKYRKPKLAGSTYLKTHTSDDST